MNNIAVISSMNRITRDFIIDETINNIAKSIKQIVWKKLNAKQIELICNYATI